MKHAIFLLLAGLILTIGKPANAALYEWEYTPPASGIENDADTFMSRHTLNTVFTFNEVFYYVESIQTDIPAINNLPSGNKTIPDIRYILTAGFSDEIPEKYHKDHSISFISKVSASELMDQPYSNDLFNLENQTCEAVEWQVIKSTIGENFEWYAASSDLISTDETFTILPAPAPTAIALLASGLFGLFLERISRRSIRKQR